MTDKNPITERDLKSLDILASKRESLQEKIDQETLNRALRDSGKKEQERQTKVIFSIEQNQNSNTIEPFYILFSSLTYETTLMAGLIVWLSLINFKQKNCLNI